MPVITCSECGLVKTQRNQGVTICADCIKRLPEDRIKLLAIRQFTKANPGFTAIEIGKRLGISTMDINRLIKNGSLRLIDSETGAVLDFPEEKEDPKKEKYSKAISEIAKAYNEETRKQNTINNAAYKSQRDINDRKVQEELRKRREARQNHKGEGR